MVGKNKKKNQEGNHEALDQLFPRRQTDTEQTYGARKQLLMPSKDLSNFSPGGRTGYTEQLGALKAPWEKNQVCSQVCFQFAWKTCCFSKPCVPQSLENAQRFSLFITIYQ